MPRCVHLFARKSFPAQLFRSAQNLSHAVLGKSWFHMRIYYLMYM